MPAFLVHVSYFPWGQGPSHGGPPCRLSSICSPSFPPANLTEPQHNVQSPGISNEQSKPRPSNARTRGIQGERCRHCRERCLVEVTLEEGTFRRRSLLDYRRVHAVGRWVVRLSNLENHKPGSRTSSLWWSSSRSPLNGLSHCT